jgi:deoxyribodipyrimidine photo-lyase
VNVTAGHRWDAAIVWFRRDIRVTDNPALTAAVAGARAVIPLFVLDHRLLEGGSASPARGWFLARSLVELDRSLRSRGSGLVVRVGEPEVIVPELARATGAATVMASRDVTPFSHRRDAAVATALAADGRRLLLQPGLLLAEPEAMLTAAGTPYGVYTPFWRSLGQAPRRTLLAAPDRIDTPPGVLDDSASLLGPLTAGVPPSTDLPEPGEAAARRRLDDWVAGGLGEYGQQRDRLDGAPTSHLGADLHVGTLSPVQVESAALVIGEPATPFVRQLAWREFYHHLLFHGRSATDPHAGDPFGWVLRAEADDPTAAAAWREGRTGIPAVDAGMRQLRETSWLSNRARLVVASFLTRHLLLDWRIGERHFLRHLVDGDVANNRGGWRWSAGIGPDAQPWFRILNPVRQGQRFDPEGTWVRRWVPELAQVPARHIHAPWEMAEDEARAAGVRLGASYPRPVVDLADARARALAASRSAQAEASLHAAGRRASTRPRRRPGS